VAVMRDAFVCRGEGSKVHLFIAMFNTRRMVLLSGLLQVRSPTDDIFISVCFILRASRCKPPRVSAKSI